MLFAQREFELSSTNENGSSLRDEIKVIISSGHDIPEEYQSLPLPSSYGYCWQWFSELSRTRTSNGYGQDAIRYSEIEAWGRLTNIELDYLEVRAIMQLDGAYLANQAAHIAKRSKK